MGDFIDFGNSGGGGGGGITSDTKWVEGRHFIKVSAVPKAQSKLEPKIGDVRNYAKSNSLANLIAYWNGTDNKTQGTLSAYYFDKDSKVTQLEHSTEEGNYSSLIAGGSTKAYTWSPKNIHDSINELTVAPKFWRDRETKYGDASNTLNRYDLRLAVDPTDLKTYKAIVDSVPANKQPKDSPLYWKPIVVATELFGTSTKKSLQLIDKVALNYRVVIDETFTLNKDITNIDVVTFEVADNGNGATDAGTIGERHPDTSINIKDLQDGDYFFILSYDQAYVSLQLVSKATGTFKIAWQSVRYHYITRATTLAYSANGFVIPKGTTLATERQLSITYPNLGAGENNPTIFKEFYTAHKVTTMLGKQLVINSTTDCEVSLIDPIKGEFHAKATGANPSVTFIDAASESQDYSLNEQLWGKKWIDGKPIYWKSWNQPISNKEAPLSLGFGIESLIKIEGNILNDSGSLQKPISMGVDNDGTISAYLNSGSVIVSNTWNSNGATHFKGTIWYTKQ